MQVHDLVIRGIRALRCDDPLAALLHALGESAQDVFPVLDGREGVVGTVSEQDLVRVLHPERRTFPFGPRAMMHPGLAGQVEDVMTPHPATVRPDDSVDTALQRMQGLDLPQLIVVDRGGRLVGLLRGRDLFCALRTPGG